MMNPENTILVVDDESYTLEFLSYALERNGFKVSTSTNGPEALQRAKEVLPRMILLDIMMPGMDGIETCIELRKIRQLRNTFIAFLTARPEDYTQIAGFEAGGDDYIKKPVSAGVLIPRLKAHFNRMNKARKKLVIEVGDLLIYPDNHEVCWHGKPVSLNRKEFLVLSLLAENPGRTYSPREIFSSIWEMEQNVNERTVNVHISRLRKKLDKGVIETVGKSGYRIR